MKIIGLIGVFGILSVTPAFQAKADLISEDQVIASLKAFIGSGKHSNFLGVNGSEKCAVSFYEELGLKDSVEIIGPLNDITVAEDGEHYDTIEEYSIGPAQLGAGTRFHLRYSQIRTERDTRDITFDIVKDASGQITSVAEKIEPIRGPVGYQEGQCQRLKPQAASSCSVSVADNSEASSCAGVMPGQAEPCSVTCQVGQYAFCEKFDCVSRSGPMYPNVPASCACLGEPWL